MAELNPFEIKAEINKIFTELNGVDNFENYEVHYHTLDSQSDKTVINKLLFKEINNPNQNLLKFLLLRYCPPAELTEHLWTIVKNNMASNQAKIFALDLLRDIDTNWSYDECNKYLENPEEFVNADTKKILDNALFNPEVQIDFLDFLSSLPDDDKIILLESLGNDYEKDELANMLIPVFLSMYNNKTGEKALELLGNSKSQLAYHALNMSLEFVPDNIIPLVKKNISQLKLAGIRQDNTDEYYKKLLEPLKPYRFCITYPDGHGNQAVILSRITDKGKVRFVAIVIDDYKGVRDCFGFNDISKFEANTIIDRFYRGQRALDLKPQEIKSILINAEKITTQMPYEYICWRNILSDIKPAQLKLNYKLTQLTNKEFEEILKYDFTDFWFLNENYSDEFENFINILNKTEPIDYEQIIDENLEKIFYPEEYQIWSDRILNAALLKSLSKMDKQAQNLYSLYNDKVLKREFLKNIIRKSIYEYYFAKNDKPKILAIEDLWVKNN